MESLSAFKIIRVVWKDHDDRLEFVFSGPFHLEDYLAAISEMRNACVRKERKLAIINILALEGDIPQFDRFTMGVHFAEVWGPKLKAAVLVPIETVNRFFENTAVNRQAKIRVFGNEEEALDWLQSPD